MIRAGEKARTLPPPERYLWIAVWWHLHSRETAKPEECLEFARAQLRLAKDMASLWARLEGISRSAIHSLHAAIEAVHPTHRKQDR